MKVDLIPDAGRLYDQFATNAEYHTRSIVSDIGHVRASVEKPMVYSEDVQGLLVSLELMLNATIGVDRESGAYGLIDGDRAKDLLDRVRKMSGAIADANRAHQAKHYESEE